MQGTCAIDGCNKKVKARGWCGMHYKRWTDSGTTYLQKPFGCNVVGCKLPHKSKGFCRSHYETAKRGIEPILERKCSYCGEVINDRVRHAEFHKTCLKTHQRNIRFIKEYGITVAEYDSLAEFQQHKCAICYQRTTKDLHVDHDHHTGSVRGLLCGNCNRGLGLLEDDTYRLVTAKEYLITPPMLIKRVYELTNRDIRSERQQCNN